MKLTHGSLFAGIGGFDLGFERAGIKTIWQVEIDEYCRRVLARHFPAARRFDDIRECFGQHAAFTETRKHYLRYVDIVSGGFPCQDISNAGKRAGIDGERSGLWSEYARLIREIRPRYVVVENVAALLQRGIERVLGDLAACGYDAEWQSIRASDVGAPHRRERIWIIAYDAESRNGRVPILEGKPFEADVDADGSGADVANTNERGEAVGNADVVGRWSRAGFEAGGADGRRPGFGDGAWWAVEPDVDRVANGVPARVDRLRGLGNAVVPQITEFICRKIVEHWEAKC